MRKPLSAPNLRTIKLRAIPYFNRSVSSSNSKAGLDSLGVLPERLVIRAIDFPGTLHKLHEFSKGRQYQEFVEFVEDAMSGLHEVIKEFPFT